MGINFPLTFLQPYLQPTTSSWHWALLNRWLAQGLTCTCSSLALVRDEWYKKILHSCWMKKIQCGPSEWNCYFQWVWLWTWYIFKGQLNLLGICEKRSRNYLVSLLLGLITVKPVILLTNEDSSGSCFSQQLRELNTCFREIFHDTCFLRNTLSPLIQRDPFLMLLTNC